jgi:membrane protein
MSQTATAQPPKRVNVLQFTLRKWGAILWKTIKEFNADDIPSIAGGVTFFMLLAFFPAIAAFVSLYGLFADVATAREHLSAIAGLLPAAAIQFVGDEMVRIAGGRSAGLSFAFVISLLLSIWSANSGMKSLMAALNIAYEEREKRSFFRLNLVSLAFTASALLLAVVGIGTVVALPAVFGALGIAHFDIAAALRWPLLLAVLIVGLAVVYRFGASLTKPKWHWITPGSVLASLAFVGASYALSWYVEHVGHYDKTYGSLGAVIGFLMWIWIGVMVVLLGAELNCELDFASGVRSERLPILGGSSKESSIQARTTYAKPKASAR